MNGRTFTIAAVDELVATCQALATSMGLGADAVESFRRAVEPSRQLRPEEFAALTRTDYKAALLNEQADYLAKIGTNPRPSRSLHLAKLLRYERRALEGRD